MLKVKFTIEKNNKKKKRLLPDRSDPGEGGHCNSSRLPNGSKSRSVDNKSSSDDVRGSDGKTAAKFSISSLKLNYPVFNAGNYMQLILNTNVVG